MKKLIILIIATSAFMYSCVQTTNKKVKDSKENLTEVKTDLIIAQENEIEAEKAKEKAEWNNFQNEADSSILQMESDLKRLDLKIKKASKSDEKKLRADFNKAKSNMVSLEETLKKRNVEFENDLKSFDAKMSEKNQSFKREFKHDMSEFGKSIKDLFRDNVN